MSSYHVCLRDYPVELRPRERMQQAGVGSLSDTELVAILLSTGSNRQTALDLAGQLLQHTHEQGLRGLATISLEQLCHFVGIGLAKATRLQAAIELGKRVSLAALPERPQIHGPNDVACLLMPRLFDKQQEHFMILILDTRNRVLSQKQISVGTLNSTLTHPREIFHHAVTAHAHAIIAVHNHPSGDPTPSDADLAITRQLIQCGDLMDIPLLDHVVLGHHDYISIRETTHLWTGTCNVV